MTIIPRGMALGSTMSLPEADRYGTTKKELLARLQVLYGGRVAEEIACDDVSSGAQSDIEQATKTARLMVTKWGMSDRVGLISLVEGEEHLFLGREVARSVDHSEATAQVVDEEIKRFLDEALAGTRQVLQENLESLHVVADALMEFETLDGEEVEALLRGDDIREMRLAAKRKSDDGAGSSGAPDEAPEEAAAGEEPRDDGKPLEGFAY